MNIYKFHSFTVEGHKKRNKIRLKEKLKKNTCECQEEHISFKIFLIHLDGDIRVSIYHELFGAFKLTVSWFV